MAREKLCEYIDLTLAIEIGDHWVLEQVFFDWNWYVELKAEIKDNWNPKKYESNKIRGID